jgi:hypothetical protein
MGCETVSCESHIGTVSHPQNSINHKERIGKGVSKMTILLTIRLKITYDAMLWKNLGSKGDKF